MLSRSELARLIDGPALDREITRLSKLGGGWVEIASVLSRRINWTLDWAELGSESARFRIVASRGEAVIFWDMSATTPTLMKLRGREENGQDQHASHATSIARFGTHAGGMRWQPATSLSA